MSSVRFTYLFLEALLFLTFVISGYLLSKTKNNIQYWITSLIPIIAFAFVSGLRFGRGIDYNGYYFTYTYINSTRYEFEPGFELLVRFFNALDVPYQGFILFCSTIYILGFLVLLKEFKTYSFYILPLFLGLYGLQNFVRWYLAFSFLLIATANILNKKFLLAAMFAVISYLIHEGMIIPISIMLLFFLFANKKVIRPEISIPIFIIMLIISSVELLSRTLFILNYLSFYTGSERAQRYFELSSVIANGELSTGISEKSLMNNIRYLLVYTLPIYFGAKFINQNMAIQSTKIKWIYNLAVFSIITFPLFSLVEIFNRISGVLVCFSFFIIGISTFTAIKQRSISMIHKIIYYGLLISYLSSLYPIIKIPFDKENDSEMLFIWDANGRKYLPW